MEVSPALKKILETAVNDFISLATYNYTGRLMMYNAIQEIHGPIYAYEDHQPRGTPCS